MKAPLVVAAAFGAVTLVLVELQTDQLNLNEGDARQHVRIATNLLQHQRFHDSPRLLEDRAAGRLNPYSRRSLLYSLYLAGIIWTTDGRSMNAACIYDPACEAAAPVRRRIQHVTNVLTSLLAPSAFLAAFVLTGRWSLSLASGAVCLLLLWSLGRPHEGLAAILLLLHATCTAAMWRRPRVGTALLGGTALGLLILTKSVFQYWIFGLGVVCILGLWIDARRRALLPMCALLMVACVTVALPWIVRNAIQTGHFTVSGRDGEALAIRAEFGLMTWEELRSAFAYYLPPGSVRDTAMSLLEPDGFGYARFDRGNREGFYRRGSDDNTGEVTDLAAAMAGRPDWWDDPVYRDAVLEDAAMTFIRNDWLKHAALTFVFLERGIVGLGQDAGAAVPWVRGVPWAYAVALLLIPALAVCTFAVRKGDYALAFVLAPIVFTMGIHAVATHFIARYAQPLIPLLAVVLALTAQQLGWSELTNVPRQAPRRTQWTERERLGGQNRDP